MYLQNMVKFVHRLKVQKIGQELARAKALHSLTRRILRIYVFVLIDFPAAGREAQNWAT